MKEPLEDFFKKKLSSDMEEGWNMPSDDIWEKALPHFKQEKSKRKLGFWLWLMTIFLVIVASTALFLSMDAKEDESLIVNDTKNIKSITPASGSNEWETKEIDSNSALENVVTISHSNFEKNKTQNAKKIKSASGVNNSFSNFGNSEINYPTHPSSLNPTILPKKEKEITNVISNINNKEVVGREFEKLLAKLPILNQSVKYPFEVFLEQQNRIVNNQKSKWMIAVQYSPTWSRLGIIPKDKNVLGSNQFQFSNNFEIGITRFLNNKWALTAGVGLTQIVSETETKKSIVYDQTTEILMPDNMIANPISFQAISPFGEFDMSTMVTMPASKSIPIGDVVDAYISNSQLVRYLSVPICLQYQQQISASLAAFSHVGVAYNYLLKDETQSTGKMMHGLDQMALKVMDMKQMNQLSKSVFSASIGFGLKKKLSSKISIFSNFSYRHSLTPIVKSANHTTKFSSLQLGIGAGYTF